MASPARSHATRSSKRKRPDETEGLWGMVRDFKDDVFCLRQPVEPEGVRGRGRVQSGPCNPHQLWGLGERSVGIWSSRLQVTKTLGEDPMGEGLGRNVVDQPAGLVNLGATCYLSSVLQCLYHDRAFRRHVYACRRPASGGGAEAQEEEEPAASMDVDAASQQLDVVAVTSMAPQSTLVEVLQRIFAELQCGERSAVDPTAFVDMLSLAKDTQQDPQEFNRLLMTHLEPMLGSGSGSGVEGGGGAAAEAEAEADAINVVQRLFIGQLRYVTHCQGCNTKWNRDETYADLQLSVSSPDGPLKTLDACLASFFANEALVEGNQYACANCEDMGNGKQDAYRGIKLVEKKLPQRLTLLLMRFVYDPKLQAKKKLAHAISIPETLDIAPYLEEMDVTMEGGLASVGRGIGDTKYHLRAVLHHSGADNAGHYTADVRRGGDEEDEDLTSAAASPARRGGGIPGEWWHFDDETVRKAKSQTWKKGAGSKSAYMLIYDRVRDASVVATKGGDIPADAMRSVNAVNAKLSAEHGVFVKRKEALEKRVEERKTFHAAHIVVVNPEEASAEEGEGEGDGEERAAAAAAQAASAADRDDEVFVPTTWLKEWVAGRDIIASALDETKATLSGECCTVPISFDDKCLCQCGKLDAMEIRLRCKVLPKAIAEKMMSADARDRTAWKVVRAEKCEECAQKLGESCDTQQRDIMAWQRLIEAIVAASANEQDRENGFWLDKKWVTALKKLQKEKIAGLMQIVKPKLTTAKKKKTSTPQKKKPTPSPSNQPKMTEHFGNASDDAILLKRATGSSSSSSSPSFSSFSSASSSSASAAVASAAGATAHDVHDLTDLTTDLTDAAPAPEAAVVPIRRGFVHAHPPTLNALLRCTCSLGIHVGINVNKSKVWKISGELWEKLKTTFDDGGEVLELPILHDHLQRPQVCETCKQGHATVRETKNLRKQRQEEACLGLERIRSARDVKRTSRVAGHGDLRGGKVGPGEYHVVPVRWLQRWRAKMDQCEVDSSPLDFSGILCEHKKALKSGYFEEQLRLQAALALISYAEEGSASASPYEVSASEKQFVSLSPPLHMLTLHPSILGSALFSPSSLSTSPSGSCYVIAPKVARVFRRTHRESWWRTAVSQVYWRTRWT